MDYRWDDGSLLEKEEYQIAREVEAGFHASITGFLYPFAALMIIGIIIGGGPGGLIGLIAGATIGLIFNSILTRFAKWLSSIMVATAAMIAIILMR
jgi:hypothetical protein